MVSLYFPACDAVLFSAIYILPHHPTPSTLSPLSHQRMKGILLTKDDRQK